MSEVIMAAGAAGGEPVSIAHLRAQALAGRPGWSRSLVNFGYALGRSGAFAADAYEEIEEAQPWPDHRRNRPGVDRAYLRALGVAQEAYRRGAAEHALAIAEQHAVAEAWLADFDSEVYAGGRGDIQAAKRAAREALRAHEPGEVVWESSLEGAIFAAAQAAELPADHLVEAALAAAHDLRLSVDDFGKEIAITFAHEALMIGWDRGPASEPEDALDLSAVSPTELRFDLAAEPGLLGDIARWCSEYAFRPVSEFAQPAAIGFLAALFGRRFATPTGLGLNLYIVGIAETGGGKDALVSAPRALLAAGGLRHLIGPGDFTSDAAIEHAIRLRASQLMCIDEFGKLAQAMTGRNAASFARLAVKALLELYPRSAPHSEWSGKQRAGDSRDSAGEPIFSPTLSIVGVSTPAGFFEGMTESTLEDGVLNRLTLIVGGQPGTRQKDPARLAVPAPLLEAIKGACEASTTGNLSTALSRDARLAPAIRCVPWADAEAEAAIEDVEAWEDAARDAGRGGICGRAAEQTQKVATLRALAREPANPAVTAEDVAWAWSFIHASIRALEDGARQFMASSGFEELVKAVERELHKAGSHGLAYSKLLEAKTVAKAEPRLVDAAIKRLEERRVAQVQIGTGPNVGRPGKRIRPLQPEA